MRTGGIVRENLRSFVLSDVRCATSATRRLYEVRHHERKRQKLALHPTFHIVRFALQQSRGVCPRGTGRKIFSAIKLRKLG
jgi:hypothetical protein